MNESIIIDVKNILDGETGKNLEESITSDIENVEEYKIISPICGKVDITNIGDYNLLVKVELMLSLELICSRCAKNYNENINLNFNSIFNYEPSEDEYIINNKSIDIWPAIRQEILLKIPMQPLCSIKCKGINI